MMSLAFALAMWSGSDDNHRQAVALVERSMQVLGGRSRLESIRSATVRFSGHAYLAEQSERPTGPFLCVYSRGAQTLDFDAFTVKGDITSAGLIFGPDETHRTVSVDPATAKGASPLESWLIRRRLMLGPERALFLAAQAPDLALEKDRVFNGVPHQVVKFQWGKTPVRLFLKRGTASPSAIETTSPMPFPWSVWGDAVATTRWGQWEAHQFGIMSPDQFTTDVNGIVIDDETVVSSELTLGAGQAMVATPMEPVQTATAALMDRYKPVSVADGITQYQGPFNTFVIDQPDGLVVVEPVLDSSFATAFLDRLAKDFPGRQVKAVVPTDDAWPHFGGIRTFASRGAELVVLDLNRPIVQRLLDASYRTFPDEFARHSAKPQVRVVGRSLSVGTGPNRFVLYPVAGQGSERMMMIYFPERRLLYGSDLLQKTATGFFFASYPKELAAAVAREGLAVETVFAEHLGPTPWKTVTDFVESIGRG
ncbi:MAG: hypothetical protein JST12_14005 [Armatimonadetes bacterium]|nr:hypothetical protein [Armatimonadota bacterium]